MEEQLNKLEGIRPLLLKADALRAVSWLRLNDVPPIINNVPEKRNVKNTSASLRMALPALRRRARRRGVVLARLSRWVVT